MDDRISSIADLPYVVPVAYAVGGAALTLGTIWLAHAIRRTYRRIFQEPQAERDRAIQRVRDLEAALKHARAPERIYVGSPPPLDNRHKSPALLDGDRWDLS